MLVGTGNGTFAWSGPNGLLQHGPKPERGQGVPTTQWLPVRTVAQVMLQPEVTQDAEVPGATAQGGVLNCNVSSIMLVGTGNGTSAWSGPKPFLQHRPEPGTWVQLVSSNL
ncbi:MAG: hypothetical protein IPO87_07670, partial [Flavobacteriales bacterium]|nr:hypothetical protein [Flavobacteriales bacterium]